MNFQRNRYIDRGIFLSVIFLLLFGIPAVVLGSAPEATLHATVAGDTIVNETDYWFAQLYEESTGDLVLGLRWTENTSSWLPTWEVQLVADPHILPEHAINGTDADHAFITLERQTPEIGHTYDVKISYSAELGAISVYVYDITSDAVLLTKTVAVEPFTPFLQSDTPVTKPGYIPFGDRWTLGRRDENGTFISHSRFADRPNNAVLRFSGTSPETDGQYVVSLVHNDTTLYETTFEHQSDSAFIPLPLDEVPIGQLTIHIDYTTNDTPLFSHSIDAAIGQISFDIQPVAVNRQANTVTVPLHITTTESLTENIPLTVYAAFEHLVWNGSARQFQYEQYDQAFVVHEAELDLSDTEVELFLDIPLPEQKGNWRLDIQPEISSNIHVRTVNNDRLVSTHDPATIGNDDEYTFVILPDTQYFAARHPHIFTRITDWITEYAAEKNIAAVLHVGDITDDNSHRQWYNAYTSMSLLHGVVPYVFALGNHDMVAPDGSAMRGHTRVNEYFPLEDAKKYSNVAGTMEPGRMENHYSLFTIGDTNYIVLSLEFWPPNEAIAWANEIAQQYEDHKLILLTHSYLSSAANFGGINRNYPITQDPNTTVNSGLALWELFLRLRSNSFMAIGGHVTPDRPVVPHHIARTIHGNPVFQFLVNWQDQPMGGNGWIGLFTFKPDNTLEVNVYSPYLGTYSSERTSQFTSHYSINLEDGTFIH